MGLRGENRPGRARRGRAGTKPGLSGTDRDGRHRVRNRGVAPLAVAGARSDHLVGGGGSWAVKERGEELWARRGFAPPEEEEDPGGGRCGAPPAAVGAAAVSFHTRVVCVTLREGEVRRGFVAGSGGQRLSEPSVTVRLLCTFGGGRRLRRGGRRRRWGMELRRRFL